MLVAIRDQTSKDTAYTNICTTMAQRLCRWSNIVQILYKCFVFAVESTQI